MAETGKEDIEQGEIMTKIISLSIALLMLTAILVGQGSQQNMPLPNGNRPQMHSQQNHPRPGGMQHSNCTDCTQQHGANPENRGMHIWQQLDLNRTQYAQVRQLVERHHEAQRGMMNEIRGLKTSKHQAMMNENYRLAKRINTQISRKQAQMADARVDHHQAIMRILTPEQRRQANRLMTQMRERMQGRRGEHGQMKRHQGH